MSVEIILMYTCENCGRDISLGKKDDDEHTPYPEGWIVLRKNDELQSRNGQFILAPQISGDFCSHECLRKWLYDMAAMVIEDMKAGTANVPTHLKLLTPIGGER